MKVMVKELNVLRFVDVESSEEKLRRDDLKFLADLMHDTTNEDENIKHLARIVHTLLSQSLVQ